MSNHYQDRNLYRAQYGAGLEQNRLILGETDLAIGLPPGLWTSELQALLSDHVLDLRGRLQAYLARDAEFAASHIPHKPLANAPDIARAMAAAAALAGVGPMATVAGAFAAAAGRFLRRHAREVIVENGGDIYVDTLKERIVGVYAGADSPFTGNLAIQIAAAEQPLGICASSGVIGPSFSYGKADVAVIVAPDTLIADAAATAVANRIHSAVDLQAAVEYALTIPGVAGALAICGGQLAALGRITLTTIRA